MRQYSSPESFTLATERGSSRRLSIRARIFFRSFFGIFSTSFRTEGRTSRSYLPTVFELLEKVVVGDRLLSPTCFKIRQVFDIFFECNTHGVVHQVRNAFVGLKCLDSEGLVEVLLQINGG